MLIDVTQSHVTRFYYCRVLVVYVTCRYNFNCIDLSSLSAGTASLTKSPSECLLANSIDTISGPLLEEETSSPISLYKRTESDSQLSTASSKPSLKRKASHFQLSITSDVSLGDPSHLSTKSVVNVKTLKYNLRKR